MTRQKLFAAPKKLFAAAAPAASLCLALALLAAACRPRQPDAQTADPAQRQSSLAPAAAATPQAAPQNAAGGRVESPLPAPTGFVNDYAKVFDEETRLRLEEKLRRLQQRGRVEFAVATVGTTGGRDLNDYSLAVARGWGVGSKETGDGLLLLLAVEDRGWRVQVSRGLEAALPNDAVAEICQRAAPLYRDGRYGEGVTLCVDGLTARLVEKKQLKLDE